jgi:hypothetical protein
MPLQALSLGREVDIWRPQTGFVHSAFNCAVNLLLDGELWTVLGAARQDTPFGIQLAPSSRHGGIDVRADDRVHVRAHWPRRCTRLRMSTVGGTPAGIDARLVADSGVLPIINTGTARRMAGVGQIGAGITTAPMECFNDAIAALSTELDAAPTGKGGDA